VLLSLVILYLLITIAIGLYAARRVKNTTDFAIAGRHLPLFMIVTTTFATWFGSETVLGIPAKFIDSGLGGVVEDPFGAGTCLILVGLFFAGKLYRMTLLTISDYYRERYGRLVEVACSLIIMLSYLGWVSAQVTALGLVFNILSGGAVSISMGMVIGVLSILAYTLFGGMWSVAVTDFIQMIILVLGLAVLAVFAGNMAGGAGKVIEFAASKDLFRFWPEPSFQDMVFFLAAALTMMLGSIPQQDVFQRVMSANSVKSATRGPVIGGLAYILFAFVPMFLVASALIIMPEMSAELLKDDPQRVEDGGVHLPQGSVDVRREHRVVGALATYRPGDQLRRERRVPAGDPPRAQQRWKQEVRVGAAVPDRRQHVVGRLPRRVGGGTARTPSSTSPGVAHTSRSPLSRRTPRAQSAAGIRFFPTGWTSPSRTGTVPVPTCTASLATASSPGFSGSPSGSTSTGPSLMRCPAVVDQAPGAGVQARIRRSTAAAGWCQSTRASSTVIFGARETPSPGCSRASTVPSSMPSRVRTSSSAPPSASRCSRSPAVSRGRTASVITPNVGPASRAGTIRNVVAPVTSSPAHRACCTGAAPRHAGSSEKCRLTQPCTGMSRALRGSSAP
jgi:hypothetical protein